ncbi:hypothetical protein PoB_003993700 [Plakobranchus ocellatus]|uniref:Uncharacterized protein n=1 Tax=Plakobranchus ocellatus TaxID=259542 RepID=A0AAV4B1M2_9GAST|nr:hypothetical protein PoB_003993700 [Plakobranchus ocellatus]
MKCFKYCTVLTLEKRKDKSPPVAPAQGNSESYDPVHSDNGKINPNSHLNKDELTQSKHSGTPPSYDL